MSAYDDEVLADEPCFRMPGDAAPTCVMPNGVPAPLFDGLGRFLEYPSQPELSVPFTGALTIEAWIRPDALGFPRTEGSGYVHWLGKGAPGKHE